MFTLIDGAQLFGAALLYAPLLLLPGYLVGRTTGVLSFRAATMRERLALAPLLSFTLWTAPLAALTSLFGIKAAALVVVATAGFGGLALLVDARRMRDALPTARVLAALGAWLVVLGLCWIDIEWGGGLYRSLATVDMLKHAAITRSIVDSGATPLADPFFARDGTIAFYYFYFVLPAVLETLSGGWIGSRAAVGGLAFWTGVALAALVAQLFRRATSRPHDFTPLLVALLTVGGLHGMLTVPFGMAQTTWGFDTAMSWPVALVWVPHHVTACLASWCGLLILAEADPAGDARLRVRAMAYAGTAFASAAGLSVWVTLGAMFAVALWLLLAAIQREGGRVLLIAGAGAMSVFIALPYLIELLRAAPGEAPVTFSVRSFIFAEVIADAVSGGSALARTIAKVFALPLSYLLEFGVVAVGGLILAVRLRRSGFDRSRLSAEPVILLLGLTATAALLVGSVMKSAIGNNDLGWRVTMFAQIALLIATAHVLAPLWQRYGTRAVFRAPLVLGGLAGIGVAGVAYDLVMLRAFHATKMVVPGGNITAPHVELELRRAYEWLNAHVPRQTVTQHNPDASRVFASALYGRQRVGVSDLHTAYLLGAPRHAVQGRLEQLMPIFKEALSAADVAARARHHGIDVLVISAIDPVWTARPAWLATSPPLYASPQVRIIAMSTLISGGPIKAALAP